MNVSDNSPLRDLAMMLSGMQGAIQNTVGASVAKSVSPGQEDLVRISDRAKEFQQLLQAVSQAPDIREEKVASLREAINAGTYQVSGRQVADKMIAQTMLDAIL